MRTRNRAKKRGPSSDLRHQALAPTIALVVAMASPSTARRMKAFLRRVFSAKADTEQQEAVVFDTQLVRVVGF